MSINPNREAKRLETTNTKLTEARKVLDKAKASTSTIRADLDKLFGASNALQVKIDAMKHARELAQAHIDIWKGQEVDLGYPTDELKLDAEQIKAADESLVKYATEMAELEKAIEAETAHIKDALAAAKSEEDRADNEVSRLLVVKAQQEEALKKQEAAYPAKLKRHLLKCRRHGWQDSRLAAAKK